MARLNVAVEALCLPSAPSNKTPKEEILEAMLELASGKEADKAGEIKLSDVRRFYFSVYVTDKDFEPVAGLGVESFTVKHLFLPEGATPAFEPNIRLTPLPQLPGVYLLQQNHPAFPLVNTFGVTVKKRRPTRPRRADGGIVAMQFDVGFGIATASDM